MKTYAEKLDEWYETEKKNGLLDLKIFVGDTSNSTVESLSKELWNIIHAPKRTIAQIDF